MLSNNSKMTPITAPKKQVTASAPARTSHRKGKHKTDLNGFYLHLKVSDLSFNMSAAHGINNTSTHLNDKNDEILAYLKWLEKSNHSLARRMDNLQKLVTGTPKYLRSNTQVCNLNLASHGSPLLNDRRICTPQDHMTLI